MMIVDLAGGMRSPSALLKQNRAAIKHLSRFAVRTHHRARRSRSTVQSHRAAPFTRYFGGFEDVLSIIFLASKSSLTVSAYQLTFPGNLVFNFLPSCSNNSV